MGEGKNLVGVYSSVVASLCYCYFIRIPKGKYRFISLLPIFYLFTILPLHLSFALTTGITTSFITWLANFKLLLYSFDQGPLSYYGPPKKSLLLFITIAALPIKIKQSHHNPDPKSSVLTTEPKRKIPLNLTMEAILVAILATILHSGRNGNYVELHPKVVLILYCCFLYLMVNVVVGSSSTILRAMVGLELEPPSDEPYLSTSLQDFWGRRWNLMVTNTLRHTVFIPVRSATTGMLGKDKASHVAVFASFVVSAIMHEVILYHQTRVRPTWENGSYFPWGMCCCGAGGEKISVSRTVVVADVCFRAGDGGVCGGHRILAILPANDR